MTTLDECQPEKPDGLDTVGARIAWARAQKGLSAAKLAKLVGRTRAAISLYEIGRNKPPTEMLQTIADVLEQDASWLAFGLRSKFDGFDNLQDVKLFAPTIVSRRIPGVIDQLLDKRPEAFFGISGVAILDVSAPHFRLESGDVLLLLASLAPIESDGALYAISSSAGTVIVRSEPVIDRELETNGDSRGLLLTTGQGQSYHTKSDAIKVIGKVGGWLHRSL